MRCLGIACCGGVVFTTARDRTPMLIGSSWDKRERPVPDTEPTRPLLFMTRQQAREWCRDKMTEWRHLPDWKVRPVRVREVVEIADPQEGGV